MNSTKKGEGWSEEGVSTYMEQKRRVHRDRKRRKEFDKYFFDYCSREKEKTTEITSEQKQKVQSRTREVSGIEFSKQMDDEDEYASDSSGGDGMDGNI